MHDGRGQFDVAHAFAAHAAMRDFHAAAVADHTLVPVSYTHLRAHETVLDLVCRLLLEKKKKKKTQTTTQPSKLNKTIQTNIYNENIKSRAQ